MLISPLTTTSHRGRNVNPDHLTKVLEHVHVVVDISSRNKRGEFEIRLTSPSGTESKLLALRPLDNSISGFSNFRTWPLMSTHYWGEQTKGRWGPENQDDHLHPKSTTSVGLNKLNFLRNPLLFRTMSSQVESGSAKLWRANSLYSKLANRPLRHRREPQRWVFVIIRDHPPPRRQRHSTDNLENSNHSLHNRLILLRVVCANKFYPVSFVQ